MTCSAASTLQSTSKIPLPAVPGLSAAQNQALKRWGQQVLSQIQGAAGATGVNVIPQQYALLTGSTLPPLQGTSNCTVAIDATKPNFGQASYKISITGTPATVTFSADTAWPIHAGWQWIVSFFQQASVAIGGQLTITTPTKSYTTDFTTTLTAAGWERLFDTLNLGADSSSSFGLSFTFTGGTGQTVWISGLMMEPYFNVAMAPSPFISTSSALTIDNNPDGPNYVKLLGSHASGNVAFNYKGVWSSATAYVIGDEVVYGPTYWIAIAASTNSSPSTSNSHWQAVGSYSGFQGAWSSSLTYAAGAEVTYNGNYWICVTANTNSAPTTSNANWQIAGPTSLDNVSDGSTYRRQTATGGVGENMLDNGLPWIGIVGSAAPGWSGSGNCVIQTATDPTGAVNQLVVQSTSIANAYIYSGPVSLIPGQTYVVHGWYKTGGGGSWRFSFQGPTTPWWSAGSPTSWTEFTQTITPTSGEANSPTELLFDNNSATADVITLWGWSIRKVRVMDTEIADGSIYLRMPTPPAASAAAATSLTQSGTTTAINVGAGTYYLGNLTVSANAGAVDPGAYGTYYVYFDNPGYTGGSVTYQATTSKAVVSQAPYRIFVGTIATTSGGGGSGGGTIGCFSGDTRIRTSEGLKRFDELPPLFEVLNHTGKHPAELLVHRDWHEPMRYMGKHLVTERHLIKVGNKWIEAKHLFPEPVPVKSRNVYNIHVLSDSPDDWHYILENGLTAHNAKP